MGDSHPIHGGGVVSSEPMLLQLRIEQLEAELQEAKALMVGLAGPVRLGKQKNAEIGVGVLSAVTPIPTPSPPPATPATPATLPKSEHSPGADYTPPIVETFDPSLHLLLILSDSALPLGSFAFSSGLESYLTHHKFHSSTTNTTPSPPQQPPTTLLRRFISLSLSSLAATTLPFITAAYSIPNLPSHTTTHSATSSILYLSDTFDATTTCPVLRRASTIQGKALLSVWEKSLRSPPQSTSRSPVDISDLITSYRHQSRNNSPPHLPVVWALISLYSNLTLHQTTFVFLLNHTKALLSAAVRLNVIGPYAAQNILAAPETLEMIQRAQGVGLRVGVEEAGQTVPTLDLYQGRHELLYSRVFNS